MPGPPAAINVDRDAGRRNPRLPWAGLLAALTGLLYVASSDKRLYFALVPALVVVLGYRMWAVERFSPPRAQCYARAAVAEGGDALLGVLRSDQYLKGIWSQSGAALDRLHPLPPDQLCRALRALGHDAYPVRRLPGGLHPLNRVAALALGLSLGLLLSWAWERGGDDWAPPWPVWLVLGVVITFRLTVWLDNRRRLARVRRAIRTNPRGELVELLAPAWQGRRHALIDELNRLADHAEHTAEHRPVSELSAVSLLVAAGIALGLATRLLSWLL